MYIFSFKLWVIGADVISLYCSLARDHPTHEWVVELLWVFVMGGFSRQKSRIFLRVPTFILLVPPSTSRHVRSSKGFQNWKRLNQLYVNIMLLYVPKFIWFVPPSHRLIWILNFCCKYRNLFYLYRTLACGLLFKFKIDL